jgi:hypothetical protein
MSKQITQQTLTGQAGVNLIEKRVLQMGWIWNATNIDAGIDGYIEIRDPGTGRATNIIVQVQSKALSHLTAETPTSFEFVCSPKDLEYWLAGNAPVILVVSRPANEEAYWVSIKDHFNTPTKRRERRVVFDKHRDRFDVDARDRLAQLAMPRFLGVYLTPPPRTETLFSNLLRVAEFPHAMYRASTPLRDGREIRKALGYSNDAPDDWFARNKQVISFQPFTASAWDEIIDRGTEESFDLAEWAFSPQRDRINEFLELMFHALKAKLRPFGVAYFHESDYFYFTASQDLKPKRIDYRSFRKNTTRTVFQAFAAKDDPSHIKYYRHVAFKPQFLCFDRQWYLSIEPTYHFTFDGWRQHKWYESKLKGIKALEKNPAVLGQVAFWMTLLKEQPPGLFKDSEVSALKFGDLESHQLEAGINETMWLWSEEDDSTKKANSEVSEFPLLPIADQQ